jgi:hypothetical protein
MGSEGDRKEGCRYAIRVEGLLEGVSNQKG